MDGHAKGQKPKFLYIGCADSRVAPNEITGTTIGEIFVQRNVANLVLQTDHNLMAVLQYAAQVLQVDHVIVCGHTGCGGVAAALDQKSLGPIDAWLSNVKDSYLKNQEYVDAANSKENKVNRLVECNVREQVYNLYKNYYVQFEMKARGMQLHGWVYDLKSGLIKDLEVDIEKDFKAKSVHDFI